MARAAGQEPGPPGDPARPGQDPGDCGTQHPPQGQRAGCSRGVCKDRLPSSGRSRGDVSGFADTRPLARVRPGGPRHPAPCAATRAEGANPICACARLGCVSSRSASGPRAPRLLPLQSAPFRERVTMTHDPRAPGCAPRHPPAGLGRSGLWGGASGRRGTRRPQSGWGGRWTSARHQRKPVSVGGEDTARDGLRPRTRRPPRPGVQVPRELSPHRAGGREALSTWRGQLSGEPLAK